MPRLTLFRRKVIWAGDDLLWPALFNLALRIFQFAVSLPLMIYVFASDLYERFLGGRENCIEKGIVNAQILANTWPLLCFHVVFSLVLAVMGIVIFGRILYLSRAGTPTETAKRSQIPLLCHIHLTIFTFMRIFALFVGATLFGIFYQYCQCADDEEPVEFYEASEDAAMVQEVFESTLEDLKDVCGSQWTIHIVLFNMLEVSHIVDAIYAGLFYIPCLWKSAPAILNAEAQLQLCCKCFFGCLSCMTCSYYDDDKDSKKTKELDQFASFLSAYLNDADNYIDVAISDVIMGLNLVRLEHLVEESDIRNRLIREFNESAGAIEQNEESDKNKSGYPKSEELFPDSSKHISDILHKIRFGGSPTDAALASRISLAVSAIPASKRINQYKSFAPVLREMLSSDNPYERYIIAEAARFICFADAIYVWSSEDRVESNCCDSADAVANSKSPLEMLNEIKSDHSGRAIATAPVRNVSEDDMVYAQYKEGLVETPYAIVMDHAWKSVVITIRGTQSLDDVLADISWRPVELKKVGEECGFDGIGKFCHSGILGCTEWLYWDIKRHGKLDKLLLDDSSDFKNYRLRVTGHSLGGACAAVLSIFLRPKFKNIRCIAFSPPGCTLSENIAKECSRWTTSVVLDSDAVPRFSVDSLEVLRDELLEMIARTKVPKHKVLDNRNVDRFGTDAVREFLDQAIVSRSNIPPSKYLDELSAFREYIQKEKEKRSASDSISLFPPGKLVQLMRQNNDLRIKKSSGCLSCANIEAVDESGSDNDVVSQEEGSRELPLTARWIEREDLSRIALTSHFLSDHLTVNIRMHLSELATSFKLSEPFSGVLSSDEGKVLNKGVSENKSLEEENSKEDGTESFDEIDV